MPPLEYPLIGGWCASLCPKHLESKQSAGVLEVLTWYGYHERTLRGLNSCKYSEINQLPTAGFFTSGVKIKSKSLKSQRQTSVVEQEQTKKPPIWEAFFVSKSEFALSDVTLNWAPHIKLHVTISHSKIVLSLWFYVDHERLNRHKAPYKKR